MSGSGRFFYFTVSAELIFNLKFVELHRNHKIIHMKNKLLLTAILGFSFCAVNVNAQRTAGKKTAGPYTIRNSEIFESPKGHLVMDPLDYGKDGIVQINCDGLESINLQKFSADLKFQKENTIEIKDKFNERVNLWGILKLKNKAYLMAREVFRETETEGLTALELAPLELNVVGSAKNLFQSSGKVRMATMAFGYYPGILPPEGLQSPYDFYISNDNTKFLTTYYLTSKERNDKLNKDVVGMQVFDENLVKQWGQEFEMPYTEAKMDNLGYTLGNDGKVYLLAKVYEGESKKDGAKDKTKANYHFEVMVFQKGVKTPKSVEIRLENGFFNKDAYIYQDSKNNIVIAGFYGKPTNAKGGESIPVQGSYMVTLDVEKSTISKVNGGYYEIPSDLIKAFSSDREKRKMEKKEEKDDNNDIGIDYLRIRDIYEMPNGSTKIVSEQYIVVVTVTYTSNGPRTTYKTFADDIFVISIDAQGKQEWVRKIPKAQFNGDPFGKGLSINSIAVGDDIHVFYKDKPENSNLSVNEAPKRFGGINGMLRAVTVNAKGEVKGYDLVDVAPYDMHFNIRNFVYGGNKNLISTERRKRENMLFSIDVK
ncbi:MAG: hypothetical protein JWO44_2291 [Bacteroidetes bacterium]|nr:hypothetical protein [Bacteroidota bacterium]